MMIVEITDPNEKHATMHDLLSDKSVILRT